ncbi:MAG: peptidase M16 [Chloroflexi bacterium]|nr:peptidase M16 [Chloroflexota bacterium]
MSSFPDPPAAGTIAPFSLPAAERNTLDSGLSVISIPSGSIPKVYLRLVLGFGMASENPSEIWLTQLLSDYLKEGAGDLDAVSIANEVGKMGGHLNVTVDDTTTTISASVLSEFAPNLVRVLAKIVREPLFPESELERLIADMLRRLDLARSQPGMLATGAFLQSLYGDHPYGRFLSTADLIKQFTTAAVRAMFEGHAGPQDAKLYVAGQFDEAAVLDAANDAFADWGGNAGSVKPPQGVTNERSLFLVNRPEAEQSTLSIGLHVPDPQQHDYVPLVVTNALLGGSFYSRITLNIREDKGFTYSPRSQVFSYPGAAYWVESADVTTNVTAASIHEIFFEIDRLGSEPASSEELEGIQQYVAGNYILRHATPGGIIDQLEFLELHHLDEQWAISYTDQVLALTTDDIQRIAEQHLQSSDMRIVIVGDITAISEGLLQYGNAIEVHP